MNNPVVWFEIYVQDMNRASQFYQKVLQTELQSLPGGPEGELNMMAFPGGPEHNGAAGALVYMPDVSSGGNSTLVYFDCEDVSTEEARIKEAGGEVVRPKMSIGEYGFITLATDPDGNLFGLHSSK